MPASTIYKPGTYKGPVFLVPSEGTREPPVITTADGQSFTGRYLNTNEGRHQFVFPRDLYGLEDLTVSYGGQSGKITSGRLAYESFGGLNQLARRAGGKGDVGAGGFPQSAGGGGGSLAPGTTGFGAYPADLTAEFPSPVSVDYTPTETAPYDFTDPLQFGSEYAPAIRDQLRQNMALGKEFALANLDTELQGLANYVPAAAALKRRELSIDNIINQQMRQRQLEQGLPGVREALAAQTKRAESFAGGRVPDEITDRALELGVRSAAADASFAGGFGATSAAARNISDVMSVQERLKLSEYGDQLLTRNVGQRADVELAPTQYSKVGEEIRATPEVGAGRQAAAFFSETNQQSIIPATTALGSTVQQRQYGTNLEQQNRQFNAGNTLQNDQFNATNANTFALTKFQYRTGLAAAMAGAAQTDINTNFALSQQKQYQDIFQDNMRRTQQTAQTGAIFEGIAGILTAAGVGARVISSIKDFLGLGTPEGGTRVPDEEVPGAGGPNAGGGTRITTPIDGGGVDVTTPDRETTNVPPDAGTSNEDFGGNNPPPEAAPPSEGGGIPGEAEGQREDFTIQPGEEGDSFGVEGEGPGAEQFSSESAVPETSAVVSKSSDGSVIAVPKARIQANTREFETDTGTKVGSGQVAKSGYRRGNAVLAAAGMSSTPKQGYVRAGVDRQGNPIYVDPTLAQSKDRTTGERMTGALKDMLGSLGVFSDKDSTTLDRLGALSSDAEFLATLAAYHERGDSGGFISTILGRYGNALAGQFSDKPQTQSGISAAMTAYRLFTGWDQMSTGQKSLGLAALGLQGYRFATGESLADKYIVSPDTVSKTPGLSVGQALNLFQSGYNVYSLVKNWDQLSNIQRVLYGTGTAVQLAQTAREFGLIGAGQGGAAAGGVSAGQLAADGWSSVPTAGPGAISAPAGTTIPEGYTVTNTAADGTITAVPAPNYIGGAAGAVGVAAGAYQVYQGWGTGGKAGAINGAVGGTAMAAGLYAMGSSGVIGYGAAAGAATNPYVLAAVVAISIAGNAIKTGKTNKDHIGRDAVRKDFVKRGIADKNEMITLPDGTTFDFGADDHNINHQFAHPEKLPENLRRDKIRAYDVDYTNDLDYTASLGAQALTRIMYGGKARNIDQMAGQLANASIANIGFGKNMDRGNFEKMTQNLRSIYAKAGITSKNDAYALANQAFAEGRINETDLVAMQQGYNIVFDNDYDNAQRLMSGRWRGLEVAVDAKPHETVSGPGQAEAPPGGNAGTTPFTQEDVDRFKERNRGRTGSNSGLQPYRPGSPPGTYLAPDGINKITVNPDGTTQQTLIGTVSGDNRLGAGILRTKDGAIARNRERYGAPA